MGKRALFWMPAGGVQRRAQDGAGPADPERSSGVSVGTGGRHALFSDARVDADASVAPQGAFTVTCSSCASVSRVGVIDLVLLQLPMGGWFPRKVFDRWMTCPACRRRTWMSVTLTR